MIIRLADARDKMKWDAYAASHPDMTPYHFFAWREAVCQAYDHEPFYFIAEENDQILGILPLIHLKLAFLHSQLIGLPFCDIGGPLVSDPEVEIPLLEQARKLARRIRARKLEIRSRTKDGYRPGFEKVSMLLHLPASGEDLWNGFKSKLRSQIRKAEKNGLVFRWGERSDFNCFYRIFARNMRELGSPVHSRDFLGAVIDSFGERAGMGLVFYKGLPVGCGLILLGSHIVSIPWASTLREYNHLNPNMLLYWNFLKFSADSGYGTFDFGRSTYGAGTFHFKSQWGAVPASLNWRRLEGIASPVPGPARKNDLRALMTPLWQRLPETMANWMGPKIRKHIAL